MAEFRKRKRPRVVTDPRQLSFEFVEPTKYEVELVSETPHGYGLFRRLEGHGGYAYWTDQYGTGYMVYDEGTTDLISTFSAMCYADREAAESLWKHLGEVFGFKE